MKLIIDIDDEVYDWFNTGFPDEEDAEKLWQIVKNGTPLPDNATNGDVIKAMFPKTGLHIDKRSHTVWVGYEEMSFHIDWWNSPYQKGGKW